MKVTSIITVFKRKRVIDTEIMDKCNHKLQVLESQPNVKILKQRDIGVLGMEDNSRRYIAFLFAWEPNET